MAERTIVDITFKEYATLKKVFSENATIKNLQEKFNQITGETKIMEPVLLQFNESDYNNHIKAYEPALKALNEAFKAYDNLGLQPLGEAEFKQLFARFDTTLFDKATNGKKVEDFQSTLKSYNSNNYARTVLENAVIQNSEIILSESFTQSERKQFEVWATTDTAIKAYEFAKKVIDAATQVFGEDKINIPFVVTELINYNVKVFGNPITGERDFYKHTISAQNVKQFVRVGY